MNVTIRVYTSHTGMAYFAAVSDTTERENVLHRTEWFEVPEQTVPALLAGHKRAARTSALHAAQHWAVRNGHLPAQAVRQRVERQPDLTQSREAA